MVEFNSTERWGAEPRPPFSFARLISPIGIDKFKAEYWEKKHVVLHRSDPSYYADLLTLPDMDHLLATSRVHNSNLRIMSDGKETPISELVSEDPASYANALESVYAQFRAGATINLLFLQEQWPPLARVCRSLADALSAMFHVNVYLTPAGERGLAEHYDTHDVFVAQVSGSKRWRLYEPPVRLPLKTQRYRRPEEGPGEPIADFHLFPGDLLYMPRGTVHHAESGETASLHLTIGVQAVLWADLLRQLVDTATGADYRFRQALPMGFANDERLMAEAERHATELLDLLRAGITPQAVVAAGRAKAILAHRSSLDGHLLDLVALSTVDSDTKVRRRPELAWRLVDHDDQVVAMEFHGKEVCFPGHARESVTFVAETPVFTAREITGGLDEAGRLVLVRTLIKEGFLTLADRPA